jgi:hypothetical protein
METAVEWLEKQTRTKDWFSLKRGEIFENAKEMEKVQIMNAYIAGDVNGVESMIDFDLGSSSSPEEYYNSIFKKEENGI